MPNPSTFDCAPMTLVNSSGGKIYGFDSIKFTIFQDPNTQYTLTWNATSYGWQSLKQQGAYVPEISVEVEDSGGGPLDTWNVGSPDEVCHPSNPQIFTYENGKPNILSVSGLVIVANVSSGTWVSC